MNTANTQSAQPNRLTARQWRLLLAIFAAVLAVVASSIIWHCEDMVKAIIVVIYLTAGSILFPYRGILYWRGFRAHAGPRSSAWYIYMGLMSWLMGMLHWLLWLAALGTLVSK